MKKKTIVTPTYSTEYTELERELIFLDRTHDWGDGADTIECFPNSWVFSFGEFEPGHLAIKRKGRIIPFEGKVGFFCPPFGIVNWLMGPGMVKWGGYFSLTELPPGLPTEPVLFEFDPTHCPLTADGIISQLKGVKNFVLAGKLENESKVAERTKNFLDQNFSSKISMREVASRLGYSHEVVCRAFKACFGLTPTKYRNNLRVFEAVRKLLFDPGAVGQIGDVVGFGDISRFNKNFKEVVNSTHSLFKGTEFLDY